jgi:hypothetical protein
MRTMALLLFLSSYSYVYCQIQYDPIKLPKKKGKGKVPKELILDTSQVLLFLTYRCDSLSLVDSVLSSYYKGRIKAIYRDEIKTENYSDLSKYRYCMWDRTSYGRKQVTWNGITAMGEWIYYVIVDRKNHVKYVRNTQHAGTEIQSTLESLEKKRNNLTTK